MPSDRKTLTVTIAGKPYKLSCTAAEYDATQAAAKIVDHEIQSLKASAKTASPETLAVLVALNQTADLLNFKAQQATNSPEPAAPLPSEMRALNARLDQLLKD